MTKLLQINVTANWGSTGIIAENIGNLAIEDGWDSWIAYGRGNPYSTSTLVRIGNDIDMRIHGVKTRLFDNHGLASKRATKVFLKEVEKISPDVIHLHNIHGYYLNYPLLFEFLKKWGGPVVWTLHDCWPFTGHCSYYFYQKCDRWQTECNSCIQLRRYPTSLLLDRSRKNYHCKKDSFLGLNNLTLVPVSNWLNQELSKSFLSCYPKKTIYNGIDLSTFSPCDIKIKENQHKIILGVASVWDERKGLEEFKKLRKKLSEDYIIILVGLSQEQISSLPPGIEGIKRTESIRQLVDLYSMADVFVNPTLEDNFPTTNIESLACGTPVITYDTGGSPEAIDEDTGIVVPYRNVELLAEKIIYVCELSPFSPESCRLRAEKLYNNQSVFRQYIELYNNLIRKDHYVNF